MIRCLFVVAYGLVTAVVASAQNLPTLPARPCAAESQLRSSSGPETTIRFQNNSSAPVTIWWLDSDGRRTTYGTIGPHMSREQQTYATHVWVVSGPTGCVAIFVAGEGRSRAVIGSEPPTGPVVIDPPRRAAEPVPAEGSALGPPPADLGLSPFYQKYLDASGIPIVGSARVPDRAIVVARDLVLAMLRGRDDVARRLAQAGVRVAIMASTELTLDIPEHSDLQQVFPATNWNERARGLGATPARPATSGAEENVLCYERDRYRGESILLHEFAHTFYGMGIAPHEPDFRRRVEAAYRDAMARGLWRNTYAATNVDEYWAEGVQSWFDTNIEAIPTNGIHNHVNTREELIAYDPALATLIAEAFPGSNWRLRCP